MLLIPSVEVREPERSEGKQNRVKLLNFSPIRSCDTIREVKFFPKLFECLRERVLREVSELTLTYMQRHRKSAPGTRL